MTVNDTEGSADISNIGSAIAPACLCDAIDIQRRLSMYSLLAGYCCLSISDVCPELRILAVPCQLHVSLHSARRGIGQGAQLRLSNT